MSEPTRPIRQPTVDADGSLVAHTVATPKSFKVRAKVTVGSRKVIPVIFVPGIMGTNLRVRAGSSEVQDQKEQSSGTAQATTAGAATHREQSTTRFPDEGFDMTPGEPIWRPPNGVFDGLYEASKWKARNPAMRQRLLDPTALEVDGDGDLGAEVAGLSHKEMRSRGWGEIHLDSYGAVLEKLQTYLDTTFRLDKQGKREIRVHWKRVMQSNPADWGARSIDRVTEHELEKFATYQYPVYAVGYNWLESCADSAQRLSQRIDQIKAYWRSRKHECDRVILVTHSMGGLVARACARMRSSSTDDGADIAGIIHGVMPTFGAPVAYRRIACGTEGERYTNGLVDNIKANRFVEIAGTTPADTMAVMATAPGVLALLPNHLYPGPWLLVKAITRINNEDVERQVLALPTGNPYVMYRDFNSWFRLVDPELADPAGIHQRRKPSNGQPGVGQSAVTYAIRKAIDAAEHLHRNVLSIPGKDGKAADRPYFHPNTYAFYGSEDERRAYGTVRWAARVSPGSGLVLTPSNMLNGRPAAGTANGARDVCIEGGAKLRFQVWGQDAPGDDTVPRQSAAGVAPYVREVYAARGFGHQDCFSNDAMLSLTRHLIVKIVQGIK